MTATPSIPPSRVAAAAAIDAIEPIIEPKLSPGEKSALNDRQDQIMSLQSIEGTPPSHAARRIGWTIFLIGLPIVLVGGLVTALLHGIDLPTVLCFAVIMTILLTLGGGPVLAAGLSRGREEATARVEAMDELHPGEEVQ